MKNFQKYAYEEVFRYYEFTREDGLDGLAVGETIASHAVTCTEKAAGTDRTATMISTTSASGTKVTYLLKGGTADLSYYVFVKVVTSAGQKLEGKVTIDVV